MYVSRSLEDIVCEVHTQFTPHLLLAVLDDTRGLAAKSLKHENRVVELALLFVLHVVGFLGQNSGGGGAGGGDGVLDELGEGEDDVDTDVFLPFLEPGEELVDAAGVPEERGVGAEEIDHSDESSNGRGANLAGGGIASVLEIA